MENEHPKSRQSAGVFTTLFCVCMLGIFPLYIHNKLFDVVSAKLIYFLVHLLALAFALACAGIVRLFSRPRPVLRGVRRPSFAAVAVGLFAAACIVSALLSRYPWTSFFGTPGRFMGLLMLLACCFVYALVRSFLPREALPALLRIFLVAAALVALLAVFNHFGADPLRTFPGIRPIDRHIFLSTIGNINFLSSFLNLALPVGLYSVLRTDTPRMRAFYVACSALCFAGLLAANSDSGYVGLLAVVLVVVCTRAFNAAQLQRLCALLAIFCGTALLFGLMDVTTPGKSHILRSMTRLIAHPLVGIGGGVALGLAAFLLRQRCRACSGFAQKPLYRAGRVATVVFVGLFVAAFVGANWLAPTLPLGPAEKILRFSDTWGSNRGYVWRVLLTGLVTEFLTPLELLFGSGPDTVNFLINPHYTQYIRAFNNGASFDSAHNEYLQFFLAIGLVGLVCWLLVLASHLRGTLRKGTTPVQLCLRLAIVGYAAQAFFNIAMPSGLPLLFLMLAFTQTQPRKEPVPLLSWHWPPRRRWWAVTVGFVLVEVALLVAIHFGIPWFLELFNSVVESSFYVPRIPL